MHSVLLQLKEKYGLVHVPSRHKAENWMLETSRLLELNYPWEQAGMEAARRVFGYEYREHSVYGGPDVREILSHLQK